MAADIGTVRTAIQTRLNAAGANLIAFDVATGSEQTRWQSGGVIGIIFPATSPDGRGFYITTAAPTGAPIVYHFVLELWASIAAGIDRAQRALDPYLSPAGTNDYSIEGIIEDPDDTYAGDDLNDLVGADSNTRRAIYVNQFMSYGFGRLNTGEPPNAGDKPNAIAARIPIEVYVK
jgi:hypothetical protein